jgi:hypothetical protein
MCIFVWNVFWRLLWNIKVINENIRLFFSHVTNLVHSGKMVFECMILVLKIIYVGMYVKKVLCFYVCMFVCLCDCMLLCLYDFVFVCFCVLCFCVCMLVCLYPFMLGNIRRKHRGKSPKKMKEKWQFLFTLYVPT